MVNFIAKRQVGELKLYVDGFHFGSFKDCEVCWIFETDMEMLAVAKEAYLGVLEYDMQVSQAEAHADVVRHTDIK